MKMFSSNAFDNSKLIENCFIAGISNDHINSLVSIQPNAVLVPEFLFSFPENKDQLTSSVLDFIFPGGLDVSYVDEVPKFNAIVLTNVKAIRSYLYILKFYEKIDMELLQTKANPHLIKLQSQIDGKMKTETQQAFNVPLGHGDKNLLNDAPRVLKFDGDEDDVNKSRSSSIDIDSNFKISTTNYKKYVYVPLAVCLWSYISETEFFKKILNEIFKIINYNRRHLNVNDKNMKVFQNCELLNYLVFLTSILKPPPNTRLNIHLQHSLIKLDFSSKLVIPPDDYNIKILFNALEVSTIIKLWISILTEKHIILLANQNYLLFSICEALISLIFPFRWLHTYIPVLPLNQLEYLELPTPYIMGVHSSYTDFEYLKDLYPNNVICDINTSQIYANSIIPLPQLEESKLRKKVFYAKNPNMYYLEEVIHSQGYKKKFIMEDIHPSRNFPQNMQNVFFRIFKTNLVDVKSLTNKKSFDSEKFLERFINEEYKLFWDKIINTSAFEHFILSNQYLDDSYIKIFKHLIKNGSELSYEDTKGNEEVYEYTVNAPKDVEEMMLVIEANSTPSITDHLVKYYTDNYENVSNDIEKNKQNSPYTNMKNGITTEEELKLRKKIKRYLSLSVELCETPATTTNAFFSSKEFENLIQINSQNYEAEYSVINFYSGSYNFLKFFSGLGLGAGKSEVLEIFYKQKIFREISNLIGLPLRKMVKIGTKNETSQNIAKQITFGKNKNISKKFRNSFDCLQSGRLKLSLLDMESDSNLRKMKNYFSEFKVKECFQYFLLIAYHMENNKKTKEISLHFYKKALNSNKKNFPRTRFMQFLNLYDLNQLTFLANITKETLLVKIMNYKIQKLSKLKQKILKSPDMPKIEQDNDIELDQYNSTYPIETEEKKFRRMNRKRTVINFSSKFDLKRFVEDDFIVKRMASFFNENDYNNKLNAEKILDDLKSEERQTENDKLLKMNILNNYIKVHKTDKDPMALAEEISIKVFGFLCKNSLDKYKCEMITPKFLADLNNSPQFSEIKESIAYLQKIKLNKLQSPNIKICFWLNLFNSLLIFSIIYKKEFLSNYYEWYRFLKNSYFNIGGIHMSLFEIENFILTDGQYSENIYGEKPKIQVNDPKYKLKIDYDSVDKLIRFGFYFPTRTSPTLKIYFPNSLSQMLKLNAIDYLAKFVNIDLDDKLFEYPEFITWIDPKFVEKINEYKELFSSDFYDFLVEVKHSLTINLIKFEWVLNFSTFNS